MIQQMLEEPIAEGKQLCMCSFQYLHMTTFWFCRSRWPRCLRRRSAAVRLLRLWVRIPPEGMDVCLLWELCVVRYRSLRRADHSSRGVLPTVVRCCVWSRNLVGTVAPRKNKLFGLFLVRYILYSNS
jgi:hypothetical protein